MVVTVGFDCIQELAVEYIVPSPPGIVALLERKRLQVSNDYRISVES